MGLEAGLDGQGKSRPTSIRSPDRTTCSESLDYVPVSRVTGTWIIRSN